ncbi:hypothetical protein GOV05_00165 [Candidatus Woesearchaeota archaeon]|nr:hypothetical protein [Candidatus Woesearchaeota archaeon]
MVSDNKFLSIAFVMIALSGAVQAIASFRNFTYRIASPWEKFAFFLVLLIVLIIFVLGALSVKELKKIITFLVLRLRLLIVFVV